MESNPKQKRKVTVDRVKKTKGFENLSDDQAQEILDSYRMFARMAYELLNKVPEHEQRKFIRNI